MARQGLNKGKKKDSPPPAIGCVAEIRHSVLASEPLRADHDGLMKKGGAS
jgi:hypothetical protein